MEKALGALVLAPLDVQSPSFLLTAPSHSQDIFRDHNRNLVSDGATAKSQIEALHLELGAHKCLLSLHAW